MLPAGSEAIAQTYVEGRVASVLNAGASSRPPVLRKATPFGVPFTKSSNLDCSQVRVPSARAMVESRAKNRAVVVRDKLSPRFSGVAWELAAYRIAVFLIVAPASSPAVAGASRPRPRRNGAFIAVEELDNLLHLKRQQLRARDHVIPRVGPGFVPRPFN